MDIRFTRAELAWLRLTVAALQSEGRIRERGVDLKALYGKINMLYNEACNTDRDATPKPDLSKLSLSDWETLIDG